MQILTICVQMNAQTKTTYTLEMSHPDDLRSKTIERPGLRVERMTTPCPEFNKFLHTLVGHPHRWGGREQLARMSQLQFQHLLASHGIPVHYDVADFEADLQTLREMGRL